jgi:hypothetical protein
LCLGIRGREGSNAPVIEVRQAVVFVSCPINMTARSGRAILGHGNCSDSFNESVYVFAHVKAIRSTGRFGSEVRGSVLDGGGVGNGANTRSTRSEKIILRRGRGDLGNIVTFAGTRPAATVGGARGGWGDGRIYDGAGTGGNDSRVGSGRTTGRILGLCGAGGIGWGDNGQSGLGKFFCFSRGWRIAGFGGLIFTGIL